MVKLGYEVVIIAVDNNQSFLSKFSSCSRINLKADTISRGVFGNFYIFIKYCYYFANEKPDIYLGFTIKPNILGSLAAMMFNIPVINNITGIGRIFLEDSISRKIVKFLYKFSLFRSKKIFFQNQYDLNLFLSSKMVRSNQCELLPGSGVDVNKFAPTFLGFNRHKFVFLFLGRLIKNKGIYEYIDAALSISNNNPNLEFRIAGNLNLSDPDSVEIGYFNDALRCKSIIFLGDLDDAHSAIADADCIVLPSYQEGMSRALLEAAAMGKPLIGSCVPGIAEIIIDGINGYHTRVRSSEDVASSMVKISLLKRSELKKMGEISRELACNVFDEKIVIRRYVDAISSIIA